MRFGPFFWGQVLLTTILKLRIILLSDKRLLPKSWAAQKISNGSCHFTMWLIEVFWNQLYSTLFHPVKNCIVRSLEPTWTNQVLFFVLVLVLVLVKKSLSSHLCVSVDTFSQGHILRINKLGFTIWEYELLWIDVLWAFWRCSSDHQKGEIMKTGTVHRNFTFSLKFKLHLSTNCARSVRGPDVFFPCYNQLRRLLCTAGNKTKIVMGSFGHIFFVLIFKKKHPEKLVKCWDWICKMMIDVLFADFSNVENSSEKITVCSGLFCLGILRETSSRYFFVEPPLFRMCIWMLLVNWFRVLSVRMGESESSKLVDFTT